MTYCVIITQNYYLATFKVILSVIKNLDPLVIIKIITHLAFVIEVDIIKINFPIHLKVQVEISKINFDFLAMVEIIQIN